MSLKFGINAVVTITGLTKPSDTNEDQNSWTTGVKATGLEAYIEQLDPKVAVIFSGENAFKTYQMFLGVPAPIADGDKVTDDQGREFMVQGVQKYINNREIPNHLEVMMVQRYPTN